MKSKILFVADLVYSITENDLKEFFSKYGNVVYTRIALNKAGSSKGFGFVEMSSVEEASRCVKKLHNSQLHDRKIAVRYSQDENIYL